jgi:DNA-directed RNA polymerase subunit RPC12/RpoP
MIEKLAYVKGLVEGLALDENKKDTKVIKSLIDLIEDLVVNVTGLEDGYVEIHQQLDAVDEDLGEIEKALYDDEDDDDDDCDCCMPKREKTQDELFYEVTCPTCGETLCIDEDIVNEGEMECTNCGEKLEFDLEG